MFFIRGSNSLKRNSMEKEFCTYNQALRLKALGFEEPCFAFYMGGFKELGKIKYVNPINVAETNVLAPTFSQAFRWFRENYLLDGYPTNWKREWGFEITKLLDKNYVGFKQHHEWIINSREDYNKLYFIYEEAESACLEKLLEICSSK